MEKKQQTNMHILDNAEKTAELPFYTPFFLVVAQTNSLNQFWKFMLSPLDVTENKGHCYHHEEAKLIHFS